MRHFGCFQTLCYLMPRVLQSTKGDKRMKMVHSKWFSYAPVVGKAELTHFEFQYNSRPHAVAESLHGKSFRKSSQMKQLLYGKLRSQCKHIKARKKPSFLITELCFGWHNIIKKDEEKVLRNVARNKCYLEKWIFYVNVIIIVYLYL